MNVSLGGFGRGWLLMLAFTAGVSCVALLRRTSRRLFGAEYALALWLLPPLAMLASQLPHAAESAGPLAGALLVVLPAGDGWIPLPRAPGQDWQAVVAWCWLAGVAMRVALAVRAQARYRVCLRGAVPLAGVAMDWPVWRAASATAGPALVGAWHPCIVVPADFERRYSADEQALVLAHEAMHARRHHGMWCLLAQACVALCWFHPLAWWALGAVRQDLELACDAAVLRERGGRRSYAQALLKTPAAIQALPLGCRWSARHPLTERIAMLKASQPGPRRRLAALLAGLALATGLSGIVYAASATGRAVPASARTPDKAEYQLDIDLSLLGDGASASGARRLKVALCMSPGEPASMSTHGLQLDALTRGLPDHRVRVDLAIRGVPDGKPARAELRGAIGEALLASGPLPGGDARYLVQVTPREDCPARRAAEAAARRPVSMKLTGGTVRGAAELVARQAGLSLVNPQSLGDGPAAMEFRAVPADRAMQLIAGLAGGHAVLDGQQVRFETH